MDRRAPRNMGFNAENWRFSVVLCQVFCLYAFMAYDTSLIDTLWTGMVS